MSNAIIGTAFAAETLNLLTESHLTKVFGVGFEADESVVKFMRARYSTLKLRLGLPLTEYDERNIKNVFCNEALVECLFVGVAADPTIMSVSLSATPEDAEARYEALCDRLTSAINGTRYGIAAVAVREAEDDRRSQNRLLADANTNWS